MHKDKKERITCLLTASQVINIPFDCSLKAFREQYLRLVSQQPYCLAHTGHAVGYVACTGRTVFRLYIGYGYVMRGKITS
jgi:hypothetical protein